VYLDPAACLLWLLLEITSNSCPASQPTVPLQTCMPLSLISCSCSLRESKQLTHPRQKPHPSNLSRSSRDRQKHCLSLRLYCVKMRLFLERLTLTLVNMFRRPTILIVPSNADPFPAHSTTSLGDARRRPRHGRPCKHPLVPVWRHPWPYAWLLVSILSPRCHKTPPLPPPPPHTRPLFRNLLQSNNLAPTTTNLKLSVTWTYFSRKKKVSRGQYPGGPKPFIYSRRVVNGDASDERVRQLWRAQQRGANQRSAYRVPNGARDAGMWKHPSPRASRRVSRRSAA
jgi:hypothetical protein